MPTIEGTQNGEFIPGTDGDETILAKEGNDIVNGLGGNDIIFGGDDNDQLRGDGASSYNGQSGDDQLYGEAGNDILYGGAGIDSFDGGTGSDRVSFFALAATQGVTANLMTQTIGNDGFGNAETMTSIEDLGGGTAYVDHLTGDNNANLLIGDGGDTLIGNGGDDGFQLTSAPALIDGGSGIDTIFGFFGSQFGTLVPDANGDGLAETLFATHGVNVDLGLGLIIDDGYGQGGTLVSIENVGGSGFGDRLIGDINANALSGMGGDDLLEGRGGNDTIDGGTGIDTASYAAATGAVFVNLANGTASGADGNDSLIGIENVTGSAFNDQLRGDAAANFLNGGAGNDFLFGGAGIDSFAGGTGTDRVSFFTSAATQGVTANLMNQTIANDGFGNAETMSSIEDLGGGTAFADQLTGNNNANLLIGDGGDTLIGNGGDDGFQLTSAPALIDGGTGIDTIHGFFGSQFGTLRPDNNGDGLAETVFATQGVHVDLGSGRIIDDGYGGSGTLISIENVGGSALADRLIGDGNANRLTGAAGGDTLTGGGGADTYVYSSLTDSTGSALDLILDFSGKTVMTTGPRGRPVRGQGEGDKIDLSGIDANANVAGDQAFTFGSKFTGLAGQAYASYDSTSGMTNLYLDVNGDALADMTIQMLGQVVIGGGDIIL